MLGNVEKSAKTNPPVYFAAALGVFEDFFVVAFFLENKNEVGAIFLAALHAIDFLGAFPPIIFLAVCFVLAII